MTNCNFPVVLKDALNLTKFTAVATDLMVDWSFTEKTYTHQEQPDSFSQPYKYTLSYIDAASYIKYKIQKLIKKNINLCKVNINGQVTGQNSDIHIDYEDNYFWTFVLFTTPKWNLSWGGEFMCYDPLNNKYNYVPYIPNSGVLFPSHWDHIGFGPNNKTSSMRTSLAFCFYEEQYKEKVLQKYDVPPYINFKVF